MIFNHNNARTVPLQSCVVVVAHEFIFVSKLHTVYRIHNHYGTVAIPYGTYIQYSILQNRKRQYVEKPVV